MWFFKIVHHMDMLGRKPEIQNFDSVVKFLIFLVSGS